MRCGTETMTVVNPLWCVGFTKSGMTQNYTPMATVPYTTDELRNRFEAKFETVDDEHRLLSMVDDERVVFSENECVALVPESVEEFGSADITSFDERLQHVERMDELVIDSIYSRDDENVVDGPFYIVDTGDETIVYQPSLIDPVLELCGIDSSIVPTYIEEHGCTIFNNTVHSLFIETPTEYMIMVAPYQVYSTITNYDGGHE